MTSTRPYPAVTVELRHADAKGLTILDQIRDCKAAAAEYLSSEPGELRLVDMSTYPRREVTEYTFTTHTPAAPGSRLKYGWRQS